MYILLFFICDGRSDGIVLPPTGWSVVVSASFLPPLPYIVLSVCTLDRIWISVNFSVL